MGYRDFYLFTFEQLYQDSLQYYTKERQAARDARKRLRMYANLFTRDCRKTMLLPDSVCCYCGTSQKLEIDHIIPVTKGGPNTLENMQVLCRRCNGLKNNKL